VGLIGEDSRDVALLAVISADWLYAGWAGAQAARERGIPGALSHIERLLAEVPGHGALVTVVDGTRRLSVGSGPCAGIGYAPSG